MKYYYLYIHYYEVAFLQDKNKLDLFQLVYIREHISNHDMELYSLKFGDNRYYRDNNFMT